jgi:hypothetical protein
MNSLQNLRGFCLWSSSPTYNLEKMYEGVCQWIIRKPKSLAYKSVYQRTIKKFEPFFYGLTYKQKNFKSKILWNENLWMNGIF